MITYSHYHNQDKCLSSRSAHCPGGIVCNWRVTATAAAVAGCRLRVEAPDHSQLRQQGRPKQEGTSSQILAVFIRRLSHVRDKRDTKLTQARNTPSSPHTGFCCSPTLSLRAPHLLRWSRDIVDHHLCSEDSCRPQLSLVLPPSRTLHHSTVPLTAALSAMPRAASAA